MKRRNHAAFKPIRIIMGKVYSDIVEAGLILPKKAKYTMREVVKTLKGEA